MIKGVYGFNIAVSDLQAALAKYEALLGVKANYLEESDFAFPGIQGAFLNVNGVVFNILTSNDENSPVGRFLKKNGEGILLVSLEVDDADSEVERIRANGMQPVLKKTAEGSFGKANFIHPKSMHGVQIEIFQPAGKFLK